MNMYEMAAELKRLGVHKEIVGSTQGIQYMVLGGSDAKPEFVFFSAEVQCYMQSEEDAEQFVRSLNDDCGVDHFWNDCKRSGRQVTPLSEHVAPQHIRKELFGT